MRSARPISQGSPAWGSRSAAKGAGFWPPLMAGDGDRVGIGLATAGRDRADADRGDQLHEMRALGLTFFRC